MLNSKVANDIRRVATPWLMAASCALCFCNAGHGQTGLATPIDEGPLHPIVSTGSHSGDSERVIDSAGSRPVTGSLTQLKPVQLANKPAWAIGASQSNAPDLMATAKQLAISTAIVLIVSVGMILLIKKSNFRGWSKPTPPTSDASILETIRLSSTNFVHLLQIDGARFVVGVDSSGIKSMVQTSSLFNEDLKKVVEKLDGTAREQRKTSREVTRSASKTGNPVFDVVANLGYTMNR